MVDSRAKGARAESAAKDILVKYTKLNWERIPLSGALDAKHGLKGDLYIPNVNNIYCVEVKHYADDQISTKILTDKNPQFIKWWKQCLRQATEVRKQPLLLFKHDRSKWFCANNIYPLNIKDSDFLMFNSPEYEIFIFRLEDWLKYEEPEFING